MGRTRSQDFATVTGQRLADCATRALHRTELSSSSPPALVRPGVVSSEPCEDARAPAAIPAAQKKPKAARLFSTRSSLPSRREQDQLAPRASLYERTLLFLQGVLLGYGLVMGGMVPPGQQCGDSDWRLGLATQTGDSDRRLRLATQTGDSHGSEPRLPLW